MAQTLARNVIGELPTPSALGAASRKPTRRPWRRWSAALAALVLLALGIGGVYRRAHADEAHFRSTPVVRANITERVTATGTLQPVITSPVGAQVSGIVWKLHADFNSKVAADQVLVELDPALFRNAVSLARAQLLQANANLAGALATGQGAVVARDRAQSLQEDAVATRADLDAAIATLGQARGALRSSQAQVAEAQAELDKAQLDLQHSVIRSPVDGTVISRSVDIGQAVAATFTAPTLFTIAQDLSHMQVHAAVDEADIGEVHAGQSASFTVDAFRDRTFPATVHEVRNAPQTTQNVVTYDVVLDVDNANGELRPGMTANVAILIVEKRNVLAVPNEALRFRPPAAESRRPGEGLDAAAGPAVYVERAGRAVRTPVSLGVTDGNLTEVADLSLGSDVIVDILGDRGRAPGLGGQRRGF